MFCVLCEVPLAKEIVETRFGDMLSVNYDVTDSGYAWIFPKKESVSCGIGGALSLSKTLPDILRRFLRETGLDDGIRIRGGFVPTTTFSRPVCGDGILLSGDAAGFVDPFTGEGIRYAVASGTCAAMTAAECHARGDFSKDAVSSYRELCNKSFGDNLRHAARIRDLFSRFHDFVTLAVSKNGGLMDGYLRTMTGEMDYGSFLGWIKRRAPGILLRRFLSLQAVSEMDEAET
jgi:flavin-dependent dehydrogenase